MTPRRGWSKNRPFTFTCTFNSFSSLRPSFLYIQLSLLCGQLLDSTSRGGGEHDTISESAWARRQAGETSARYRQSQMIPLVSTKSAYAIRREYWFVFAAKSIDESSTSVYKQCATTRSFSINSQYILPDSLQSADAVIYWMAPKSLVRSDRHNNNCRPLSITIMFLLHSSFIHSSIAFAYPPKKCKYFRHSLFIAFTGTLAYLLFPSQYSVTHRRYCSSIYKLGELRWLSNTWNELRKRGLDPTAI